MKRFARVSLCVLGREEGQLWYPRKVAVIRTSGKYVVCDRGSERSRMQLFTKNGQFIKKIAIRYIDIVAGLAITAQGMRCIISTYPGRPRGKNLRWRGVYIGPQDTFG